MPSELEWKFSGLVKGLMPEAARDGMSVHLHREPSRRLVAILAAQVLQYEKLLMFGPPGHVLAAQEARWGCRLTSTFGYLHGRNGE